MDSIIELKNHSGFKYVHGNRFPRQSKNIIFVFKISVDLPRSSVDFVKRMHVERNMEDPWIMFDRVKHLQD